MRQFSVGEVVTWIPDLLLRSESHGDYRVVEAPARVLRHSSITLPTLQAA